jgi:DcaP outer membrane protein/Porin subfamily
MTGKRNLGSIAAIGGLSAAIALLTGLPAVSADELADLRANQELLQKRIDQLSQAPPPGAPGPFVPGFGPEARPEAAPVTTGSFPRSFLIPGTDTSLRIGGIIQSNAMWYMQGSRQGTSLNNNGGNPDGSGDGMGGTGMLPAIPLNNTVGHSRSSSFDISARQTRLLFDARTPTAWGEVKAYVEFDFGQANENVVFNNNNSVTNGWGVRFRKGYGTMGGFLMGQESGIFHDPDADAEFLDAGGAASSAGRARVPQIKYTYQGPYGLVLTGGIENPSPRFTNAFGQFDLDSQITGTITTCSATTNFGTLLPVTTACVPSGVFTDALKSSWPEAIATARINNPWGHLQIGAVIRNTQINDGQYLDQSFVGYGGTISGDVHPFSGAPGALGKDDLGFGATSGSGLGGQVANGAGPVTNFGGTFNVPGVGLVNPVGASNNAATIAWGQRGAPGVINGINVRQAYDRLVSTQSPSNQTGWVWYQHWWTENLRSTVVASGIWNGINTNLSTNATNNKLLTMTHANLLWSPVAFVDFGLEYQWGHRVTTANFKGDAYGLEGSMRVRF